MSGDQYVPLSSASTHFGSTENSELEIVEFVGIVNPSYVELEGDNPASSGTDEGPCQVEISAVAHGASNIRKTRAQACLIGFTVGEPTLGVFQSSSCLFKYIR